MILFRYYEIDDIVVREFLGKKLSSKHRKDLDEVSEKTSIAIKSCRFVIIIIDQISIMFIKNLFNKLTIIIILGVNLTMSKEFSRLLKNCKALLSKTFLAFFYYLKI